MPGNPAPTLSKLYAQRIDRVSVSCSACARSGSYFIVSLIEERGPETTLQDFEKELTSRCPRRLAGGFDGPCGTSLSAGRTPASPRDLLAGKLSKGARTLGDSSPSEGSRLSKQGLKLAAWLSRVRP